MSIKRIKKMPKTREEKVQDIQEYVLMDDIFFEAFSANERAVEEVLQTILEDNDLRVVQTIPQKSIRNLYGRSARLDVLCILGNGKFCNIEIQRSNKDDHARRVRFNGSLITTRESNPGEFFEKVPAVTIIYISEFDIFKGGKTIYHVDSYLRETGTPYDDGFTEVFVNTVNNDGTKIARLMKHFTEKYVHDMEFPELSAEVMRLKTTKGGQEFMCAIMERYVAEAKDETTMTLLVEMIKNGVISIDTAANQINVSVEEFKKKAAEYSLVI